MKGERMGPRWLVCVAVGVLSAVALSGGAVTAMANAGGIGEIEALSDRADLISGGGALVSVDLLGTSPRAVRVELNGRNITDQFAVRPNGRYQGLVTGLREGKNILRVRPGNGVGRWIEITNHPIGGPVLSGEQIPSSRGTTSTSTPSATPAASPTSSRPWTTCAPAPA